MKQIYRVADMHCPTCALTLEGLEDRLPGIQRIAASYRKQQLEVEFDAAQVSEVEIVAAAEILGYTLHIAWHRT